MTPRGAPSPSKDMDKPVSLTHRGGGALPEATWQVWVSAVCLTPKPGVPSIHQAAVPLPLTLGTRDTIIKNALWAVSAENTEISPGHFLASGLS